MWEQLSAYVSEYPVLCDKSNRDKKDVKGNACTEIGETETGEKLVFEEKLGEKIRI